MSNGETIPSGLGQTSDLCSPKPSKSNISQGINTFLKENGFSVSPMNFSSTFVDESFTRSIDRPPVISLVTDNPSNGLKQEGFYQNFQNIIQSLNNTSSANNNLCFSELDVASQKITQQEQQEGIQDLGDGLGNHSEDRNPSMFQRAYQSDQKKKRDQEELQEDQNETESSHNNKNQDQLEELDVKNQEHPSYAESCKCTNSKCLKLYCVCFSHGAFCSPTCKCISCSNTSSNCTEVKEARKNTLSRNPHAFTSKVEIVFATASKTSPICDSSDPDGSRAMLGHKKGCKCKKTFCRKKYCECFNAGVKCSYICVCEECHNKEEEKDGGEQKNNEGNANEIDQFTVVQENKKINKRPYEPSNESSEGQHQVSDILHKNSEMSCFAVRKKQKIEDEEEEININGQGQNLILQQQSYEVKNEDIHQLEQQGQQNPTVKQLLFECETPTFKILDKQDFDPNSIVRKNVSNSTFTLDS